MSQLDHYCSLVGKSSRNKYSVEDTAEIMKDYIRLWPSFAKAVTREGKISWNRYLNKHNIFVPVRDMMSDCPEDFSSWLFAQDHIEKTRIINSLALSGNLDILQKNYQGLEKNSLLELKKTNPGSAPSDYFPRSYLWCKMTRCAVDGDQAEVMKELLSYQETRIDANDYKSHLFFCILEALDNNSVKCINLLAEMIESMEKGPLPKRIWKSLCRHGDYRVVQKILPSLEVTECHDEHVKTALIGSNDEKSVKECLSKHRGSHYMGYSISSRIIECKNLADVLKDELAKFSEDLATFRVEEIFISRRKTEDTLDIYKEFSRCGAPVVAPSGELNIYDLYPEGCEALCSLPKLQNSVKKVILNGMVNFPSFCRENKVPVLKSFLEFAFPLMSEENVKTVLLHCGSEISKWANDKGFLEGVILDMEEIKCASYSGNVYLVAKALAECDDVLDKLGERGEDGGYSFPVMTNEETAAFLGAWCSTDDKDPLKMEMTKGILFPDGFGENYYNRRRW